MSERTFPPVTFKEMITHNDLLERYPWLTPQIINKWRRQGAIRFFRGREGMLVYPRSDLVKAVSDDLHASIEEAATEEPSPRVSPTSERVRASRQEMSEADRIRERLFIEKITKRKK